MNAKTAKKLRKIALGMVVAAEEKSGKTIAKASHVVNKQGTISVAANSCKGAYKALKKGVKAGGITGRSLG
jgi:ribosomal protein L4